MDTLESPSRCPGDDETLPLQYIDECWKVILSETKEFRI